MSMNNRYVIGSGVDIFYDERVPDLTDKLFTYVNGERVGIGVYKDRLNKGKSGYTKEFFIPWYEEVFGYTPKEIY